MIKTIKLFAQWNRYSENFLYHVFESDMSDYGYIHLKDVDIEFESPPEKELKGLAIIALNKKKAQIYVKASEEVAGVDKELDSLLALEDKTTPEEKTPETAPTRSDDDIPF